MRRGEGRQIDGAGVMPRAVAFLLCLALLASLRSADARAQRVYHLQELIRETEVIATARAVVVDRTKMRVALAVDENLKGQAPYRWLVVQLVSGGWDDPGVLVQRLAPGIPLVLFGAKVKGRHVVVGYTNGTWFQISAPEPEGAAPDQLAWTFTMCEVGLRRTFAGPTAELTQIVRDVAAGRRQAPEPNPGMGQGVGAEVPADYKPAAPLPPLPDSVAKALAEPKRAAQVRKLPVRPLTADEQKWVEETARQFQRTPEETAQLLARAEYSLRDAQRALQYEREHGRGGARSWVRSAEEILALKRRSDRLSWLDVRGVLMRAGELFTPHTDPVDLIQGLRTRFSWDELDPMFDDDKWGRKKLGEEVAKRLAARTPHPISPGDHLAGLLYEADFGGAMSGELPMESCGWKPLPGRDWDLARRQYDWDGESGGQVPGSVPLVVPGSRTNPIKNSPPKPGIPLAASAGSYSGAALWLATGAGDYQRQGRGSPGSHAYYDDGWLEVRQGEQRTFLVSAQVYTPDHTDEVGEPRSGWFYIRRTSRYIDAGVRIVDAQTRSVSLVPQQALMLKLEPAEDRFDRVLLRVDVLTHREPGKRNTEGRNEVKLIAYADGIGEVARSVVDLNPARRGTDAALDTSDAGVALAPAFGVRGANDGYTPELFIAALRVQQINDGEVRIVRGDGTPRPRAARFAAARRASRPGASDARKAPGAETVVARAAAGPLPAPPRLAAARLDKLELNARVREPQPRLPAPRETPAAARMAKVEASALLPPRKGARSLIIAIDTSSSMRPYFEKARAAALELLAGLKAGDRFVLLNYYSQVEPYAPEWTPATRENLQKAAAWVQALPVASGTNTSTMLERALGFRGLTAVVLITDGGAPTAGVTDPAQLLAFTHDRNRLQARLDVVLVAPAPSDNLASRLAAENGGLTRFR
jgi:Mg-chelatase subunit ChlD